MATETDASPRAGVPAAIRVHASRWAVFFGQDGGTGTRLFVLAVGLLTLLRFGAGAALPLSFDEAYYWLWSRHLAAGYYDHPPAIAYAIRLGTSVLGRSTLGVRVVPLLASVAASWAVWRSARLLLDSTSAAARACLYFNLTLMVAVEGMAATPDALALAASALLLFALAKLVAGGDSRSWLGVGAAGGLCLVSKYTGFFLGAGVFFWLVATKQGWRWLRSPWPYAGGLVALAMFSPVIAWNAVHGWISFKFQFGRVEAGGFSARYLGDFLAVQAALASPFLLVLGAFGFRHASKFGSRAEPISLAAAMAWPALAYFLIHATHDRVQGNWPSFLYPAIAVLAAGPGEDVLRAPVLRATMSVCRRLAVPVAAAMLVAVYSQALFGVVPARDPAARLTAIGFQPIADHVVALAHREHANAVVAASYATTAWLVFYLPSSIPVIETTETYRWLSVPAADPALGRGRLLFVAQQNRPISQLVLSRFAEVRRIAQLDRRGHGALIERYDVYAVSGWRAGSLGRMP